MSVEKIVAEAVAGNPVQMKEAFEEEISTRVAIALEEKMKAKMKKEMDDEEEEDEDEE